MKNLATVLCVLLLLVTPTTWAQTSDDSSLADNEPAVNVRGGAVQERAPGRWIDAARARHMGLRDARLAAQRTGDTASLAPEPAATGGLSGTGNLISTLLGGLSSDLIGSLLGGTGSTSGTGSTGGAFSNLPPEVLAMLAGAGIDINDLNGLNQKSSNGSTPADDQTKDSVRAQTSDTTQEADFVVRWANAMLSTMFTSLTVAMQTTDFIELLKDVFRPLFNLPDPDATDGSTSSQLIRLRNAYVSGPGGSCYLRC